VPARRTRSGGCSFSAPRRSFFFPVPFVPVLRYENSLFFSCSKFADLRPHESMRRARSSIGGQASSRGWTSTTDGTCIREGPRSTAPRIMPSRREAHHHCGDVPHETCHHRARTDAGRGRPCQRQRSAGGHARQGRCRARWERRCSSLECTREHAGTLARRDSQRETNLTLLCCFCSSGGRSSRG